MVLGAGLMGVVPRSVLTVPLRRTYTEYCSGLNEVAAAVASVRWRHVSLPREFFA
jgi:hypothetical protein